MASDLRTDQRRVLFVDDFPETAAVCSLLLSLSGHACCAAMTGAAALEEVERFHPDIVVLDLGLPDMSGYEVARLLRARYGNSLYLVSLTGWGDPIDRVRAFEAGFDQHLIKPANAADILAIISASLRTGRPPPVWNPTGLGGAGSTN
jgi:DNA-binding response OmpR family regulator